MENVSSNNAQNWICIKKIHMNPILKWIYLKNYKSINPKITTNKINKSKKVRKSSVSHYNIVK